MEELYNKVSQDELEPEEQIRIYKEILALYKGEFLPKSTYSSWVVSMGVRYTTMFT